MPNSIADLIFNQMQTAGQPRTTTQRTTGTMKGTENAPLDLGSLGLLLYFMLSGKGKTGQSLGITPAPAGYNPLTVQPRSASALPYAASAPGTMPQQDLIQFILSLVGGGMGGGLGGSSGLR